MNLVKLLGFLFLSVVFVSTAMAADKAPSAATAEQSRTPIAQVDSGAVFLVPPSYESVIAQLDSAKRADRRVNLSPLGVCVSRCAATR
jgi:hypothetical protein